MSRRNRQAKTTEKYLERRLDREWNTALYARLSNENNGMEDERSLDNQIRFVEDYIAKFPNMKLVDRYVDNGFSGTNFNRPQFMRLMEDVKSGIIDCIIVKDLSRFGRNFIETGYYIEKIFPYLNVRLIAVNDNYDSFDESKKDALTLPIKNLVNEIYTKDIRKKLTSSIRAREKAGKIRYGLAPYGYMIDEENPFRYKVDKDIAPYVRQMFKWATNGVHLCEIMRRLNAANVPTPREVTIMHGEVRASKRSKEIWYTTAVRRILFNPVYMGDMYYGGSSGSDSGRALTDDGKKVTKATTPRETWRVIPNTHEPLVSREDFEKAYKIINDKRKEHLKRAESRKEQREALPDIFRGKFFCAECGRAMAYERRFRGSGSPYREYCCLSYTKINNGKNNEASAENTDLTAENTDLTAENDDLNAITPKCKKGKNCIDDRLCRTLIFEQNKLQLSAGLQLERLAEKLNRLDENKRAEIAEAVRLKEIEAENITAKLHKLYEDYREKIIDADDYISIRESFLAKQAVKKSELDDLRKQLEIAVGKCQDKEWNALKIRLLEIQKSQEKCSGNSEENSSGNSSFDVEIIEDEEPFIPGTERLTRELVDEMIERVEYDSDKALHITFRHKDWAAELAEKLEQTENSVQAENSEQKENSEKSEQIKHS